MILEEKLKIFKDKGYSYNPQSGKIYNSYKKEVNSINDQGYMTCQTSFNKKLIRVKAHQLAWYLYHDKIPNVIDHIDRNKLNNKIDNLRNITQQKNCFNRSVKGYRFNKRDKKLEAYITLNYKQIFLGYYNTEEEAHQSYLDAKKIYHIIE